MWDIMRKSLKAYILSLLVFLLLTLVLAAVIYFTDYRESWAFPGLIAALSASALLFGFMEGSILEKRGLLTGAVSALLLVLSVFLAAGGLSGEQNDIGGIQIFHLIPILAGIIGGILGANRGK